MQGDNNVSRDVSVHFPMIKAVVWFDEKKVEKNTNELPVDWQFSVNPEVLGAFKDFLTQPASEGSAKGQQYWKLLVSAESLCASRATCCDREQHQLPQRSCMCMLAA